MMIYYLIVNQLVSSFSDNIKICKLFIDYLNRNQAASDQLDYLEFKISPDFDIFKNVNVKCQLEI